MAESIKPSSALLLAASALLAGACSRPAPVASFGTGNSPPYALGGPQTAGPSRPASALATQIPERTIVVQKGDTLHGLSLTHHCSVQAIMTANNLTSTRIRPGLKLVIPQT